MKTTSTTLAVLAIGAEVVTASFLSALQFASPANSNNECNPQQSSGFDWTSLDLGGFQYYGDFSFSGWSCAGSFGSGKKRDVITGRTFQEKCITGIASKEKESSPSFGCGSSPSVKDFSVVEFQVSVEFDCELEFHFEMPDKSTCRQKSFCSKDGTVVKNHQCGGAKTVTVIYPIQNKGPGTNRDACSLGVHSMSFDCNPASSTVVSSTTSTSVSTYPASTLATTTSVPETTTPVPEATTPVPEATTPIPEATTPVPETTSSPVTVSSSSAAGFTSSLSVPETTPTSAIVESTSTPVSIPETTPILPTSSVFGYFNNTSRDFVPYLSVPVTIGSEVLSKSIPSLPVITPPSIPSYTSVDVVTVVITTSTTVCPVTLTHVTGGVTSTVATTISHVTEGSTSIQTTSVPYVTGGTTSIEIGTTTSTIVSTLTSTVCTKCSAVEITSSSTTTASGPVETAPCPAVLPSCLNTWLFSEGCSSNTDSACYCPSETFVRTVFDCLSAHAADDDEIAAAQTYFQGICAPHIPANPAIVTCATTALTTTAVPTGSTSIPVTTIQIYTTITVPVVVSTGPHKGSTIPSTSTTTLISTYLIVPQVIFTTITGKSTVAANLIPGTPASNVAITTPFVAYPTDPVPAAVGTISVYKPAVGNVTAQATPTKLSVTGSGSTNTFTLGISFGALIIAILAL